MIKEALNQEIKWAIGDFISLLTTIEEQEIMSHGINKSYLEALKKRIESNINEDELSIAAKIAKYCIINAQFESGDLSNGLNFFTHYDDIEDVYEIDLRKNKGLYDDVEQELQDSAEVAEFLFNDDGIDIILYTDYAPQYVPDDDEY